MFNSDGYILLDFTGVDITKSNQYLKGIYQRVINSIDTNKLALVINAGDLTPQAAIIHKRLNFYVITTSLYIFTVNSNDIIIIEQAGQSQVDVSIVPTLTEGVKVADFTIGAVEGSIYAPEFRTEINDNVTASNTTWSSDKIDAELDLKADSSSLATVATTGDYDDLIDKPSIPTKTSDLVNDSGFITSAQVPTIDDNTVASDKVWSSYKTSDELGNKANKVVVVTGVTKNSNTIGDAEITVLKIDKVVFVKAHLKLKAQITAVDQLLLSGLPGRSGYRNANTFPCAIGNEYLNTDSELKGVWIDGSGNLNLSSATAINPDRTIVMDFWYYTV